jgi:hypothetical protein
MEVLPMTFAVIVINRSPHSSDMTGIVHSRTATGQAYLPLLSQWLRSQQPSFGNILMMSLNRIGHAGKPQPPVHIVRMDQCPKVYITDGSHRRNIFSSYNIITNKKTATFPHLSIFLLFISLLVSSSNDTIFQHFSKNQRLFSANNQ